MKRAANLALGLTWLLPATLAAGWAGAQTVTTVDLTPDFDATVTVGPSSPGNGLTSIVEHARVLDALVTDQSSAATISSLLTPGGTGNVAYHSNNVIFASGTVNSGKQQIGIFGLGVPTDGAAIVTTEIHRFASLAAFAEDNTIAFDAEFVDTGTLNATVDGNSISANALFNAAFNLIETVVPLELATPPDGAAYAAVGSIELDANASLSIVTTQLGNSFSGQEWQPPVGDPVLATAVAAGNTILLESSTPAGESFSGALSLSDNTIRAVTRGQLAESAIVLHDQLATGNGTVTGAGTFAGTALIYGLQNSDDVDDPDGDSLGQGLHSYVSQSEILASIGNGDTTSTPGALANLALEQDGNSLFALARANDTTNEIAFDPALSLSGPFDGLSLVEGEGELTDALDPDLDEEVIFFFEREGLRNAVADYLIVSRQSMNRRDEVDPVVTAEVSDSRIAAEVTTASANNSVSLSGNTVQALAEGNAAGHSIANVGGENAPTSPLVDAIAAIVNWQWITAPNFTAMVVPADGQDVITLDVTLLGPGVDDLVDGGSYDVSGNLVSARANGNRGASAIDLEATLMTLSLPTAVAAGGTSASQAHLDTVRGATNDGDNFTASAGATLFNYQIVDSADPSHGGDDFTAPALLSTLDEGDIAASLSVAPDALATGLTNTALAMGGNSAEARAEANGYDGLVSLSALTTWSGSAGALSVQIDNDQSVVTEVTDTDIVLEISVDDGAGSLDTADLSLLGNRVLSVATVNRASQTAAIDGTVIEGADWRADYDSTDPQTSLSAVVEGYEFAPFGVTRFRGTANGSVALLSDQTADESGVLASIDASGVVLTIDAATVDATKIDASGNIVASQARINDATNSIVLDAAAVLRNGGGETEGQIELPPGPLATIVAVQGSGRGEIDTDDPGRLTEVRATLTNSGIDIDLPELTSGSLIVDNSMISASAAANVVNNSIEAEAVAIVAGLGDQVPTSEILFNSNNTDYDYSMLASFSILSSQRNESQQFDGEPRGPAVVATLENPDGEAAVEVSLENGLETGRISLDGASSSAVARGNVANNVINLEAVTIEGSAHILSRQGNDGDVIANNINGGISLVLNEGAGGAVSAGQISMDNNSIQSTAIGNAIVNVVRAKTTGGFVGPGVGDPAVVDADLPIDGEVSVSAGLSVLNSQFNGGTEGNPQTIAATVENGQIALNINGTTSASSMTASGNRVDATAIGNFANNEVTSLSSGGALPSASVYNRQLNEHSNATATVSGSGVSFVATGVVSASTFSAVSSSVSASAIGNSAINKVTTNSAAP